MAYTGTVINNVSQTDVSYLKQWKAGAVMVSGVLFLAMAPVLLDRTLLIIATLNALMLAGWSLIHLQNHGLRWRLHGTGRLVLRHDLSSTSLQERREVQEDSGDDCSFVSIHVATYAEPSEVVEATVLALNQIEYPAFEVIVVDNNTVDVTLWEPIRLLCNQLGSRFVFVHRMGVIGAKGGALDIARTLIDPRTKAIAVVDADYQVTPDFLTRGMSIMSSFDCDYVQFPQAYRSVSASRVALDLELADYFERVADSAETDSAMLLTGTLSIVSLQALDAVGGWRSLSVTEDAELGLRLQSAGYVGRFCNTIVGRGLLPPDAGELLAQRHRWIVGNVHALLHSFRDQSPFSPANRRSLLTQLTAWCSFTAIPAWVLVMAALHSGLSQTPLAFYSNSLQLAAGTVLWQAAYSAFILIVMAKRGTIVQQLSAWACRWSMNLHAGASTLQALRLCQIAFRRTARTSDGSVAASGSDWLLSSLFLAGTLYCLHERAFAAASAFALLMSVLPLQLDVNRRLRQVHPYSLTVQAS